MADESNDLTPVSVEQDGRILTGVGVSEERLESVMERHAPDEPAEPSASGGTPVTQDVSAESTPAAPVVPRDDAGRFQKQPRGAKRFDQLTGEREAEKRRADAAERERDELKARLAANQPAQPAAQPEPAAPAPKPAEKFTFQTFEQYLGEHPDASYEDWTDAKVEALADWKLSKVDFDARIRERIEADRASRSLQEKHAASVARGRQVYADFDAVLNAPHVAAIWSGDKLAAIASLDEPEHVVYALAKDPHLAEQLRTEPNLAQFGIQLARLVKPPSADAPSAHPASLEPARVVTPPPPYQPVGSGSKTTVSPSAELVKKAGFDFDKSGYREKRAAERGVNHR